MKRSEFARATRLVKAYLEAEQDLSGPDIVRDPAALPLPPLPVSVAAPASAPVVRPAASAGDASALEAYRAEISGCKKCPLGATRINFVFGVGNPRARLMFVGEGPGYDEDRQGEPFVGKAGQLLNDIITKGMKLRREDVYIANVVKCHPMKDPSTPDVRGNDRAPTDEEMACCLPYLERQIDLIKPVVICALGGTAAKALLRSDMPISRLRGTFHAYRGAQLMPTYHPAFLLRNPGSKKEVWEDIKQVLQYLAAHDR